MADNKTLTKSDLAEALKGVEKRIGGGEKRLETKIDERADAIEKKIGKTERSLKLRISKVQIDLAGRIANVSITSPTMKMFNELRDKVNRHHPTN